jgi:hypothetical protein
MLCTMNLDAYDSLTDGGSDDKRLDWLLDNWAAWMRGKSGPRGLPTKSVGLRSVAGSDFTEMVDAVDVRLARAIDAIIDSLPANERLAILRVKGLTADVWRLREPWDVLLVRARIQVRELMRKRRVE